MEEWVDEFRHLWEEELADHIVIRVHKDGKLVFTIIEYSRNGARLRIEDSLLHDLVVEKLIQAGVTVIDRNLDQEMQLE